MRNLILLEDRGPTGYRPVRIFTDTDGTAARDAAEVLAGYGFRGRYALAAIDPLAWFDVPAGGLGDEAAATLRAGLESSSVG